MVDWTTIIIAVIGALGAGGIGAAIVNGLFGRHKTKAEASATERKSNDEATQNLVDCTKVLLDVAQGQILSMEKRITALESESRAKDMNIEQLEEENKQLRIELDKLKTQNKSLIADNHKLSDRIMALEKKLRNVE
jgi:hypothetical protein